jgi:hypothetical protein
MIVRPMTPPQTLPISFGLTVGKGIGILLPMNSNQWIFKDGSSQFTCDSFPYAYRTMFNTLKKGVESGRKYNDMVKQMVIIAPTKDQHGDLRRYNYADATELAKSSEVLTATGEINSRVFKRQH